MTTRHAFIASFVIATASTLAFGHAHLEGSTPRDGTTVDGATATARLQFSERIEPALSTLTLVGPGETATPLGKVETEGTDGRVLVAQLPALKPGAYRVQWSAMGLDGHRVRGEIRFQVK